MTFPSPIVPRRLFVLVIRIVRLGILEVRGVNPPLIQPGGVELKPNPVGVNTILL